MKKQIAAAAFGVCVLSAQADEGMYGGAFITRSTYDIDGVGTVYPLAIGGRLGKQINPNFAVEARLAAGLGDDDILGATVKIDNFVGVYAKGIMPLSVGASIYGLIGYSRGKVTVSAPGISASDSDSDLSYGGGVDFAVQPNISVGLELARLFKGDGYSVTGLTFGVDFKF